MNWEKKGGKGNRDQTHIRPLDWKETAITTDALRDKDSGKRKKGANGDLTKGKRGVQMNSNTTKNSTVSPKKRGVKKFSVGSTGRKGWQKKYPEGKKSREGLPPPREKNYGETR